MTRSLRVPWARWSVFLGPLAVAVGVLGVLGCRMTDLRLWRPGVPVPQAETYEVERVRNLAYYSGPNADGHRHRLDLFLPRGLKDYPVVLLIHGGAWLMGDNRCCGLYSSVGEFLASQGIGAVLPNYRLSPWVKHPEHIRDVARAFAWTHDHIAEYGGNPGQLFVIGHSAGGHLAALLATDEKYLKAEGRAVADIKGVIAVSGVYRIPPGTFPFTLGGATQRAFSFDELTPFRGAGGWSLGRRLGLPGLPMGLDVFGPSFGGGAQAREDASPLNHVRPGLPPFLIFSAENDLPTLPEMAEEFHQALVSQGCVSQFLCFKDRNHNSVLFKAIEPEDPAAQAVLAFIRQHLAR